MSDAGGATTASRSRRGYLDWLRGIAVLIMIEAHVIDSWTRFPDRQTHQFGWALIVGGFGAPLFLFLAGVAVSMSAGAKSRRSGDARLAADAVARRGLEIFALAFLFRVQAWILGWSSPRDLLKVDILNIMGPSIVAAVLIWRLARTPRGRYIALSAATLFTAFLTPLVREWALLTHLPDPIEAYIRPIAGLSNFVFFPWMAFVFAGAVVGLALDDARSAERERLTNVTFFLAGAATAYTAYRLSFLPTWYPVSRFWTTSPAFFFLRIGIMTMAVGVAYLWELRPGGAGRWSPLRQLGRTSLFIYWIHVEMVYGLISLSLHKHLSLPQAWVALALFSVFMLACSIAKDRFIGWWNDKGARVPRGQGARVPQTGC